MRLRPNLKTGVANGSVERGKRVSVVLGCLPLVLLVAAALSLRAKLPAWGFMWALAAAIFFGLKWLSWWRARSEVAHSAWRSWAYLFGWPGMDAESFLGDGRVARPSLMQWCWAMAKTGAGIALLFGCARLVPEDLPLLRGWIGLLGLILVLHFGSFELIALGWRALGVDAEPIMQSPIASRSLSEFWGKRWNLGFRQLSYDFIFQPLHRVLGVAGATMVVFLFSGLIHESVISLPARGGYGLPTGYFLLQGFGVILERSRLGKGLALQRGFSGWAFMAIMTAGPAFWLFHPPFVMRVALPFLRAIRAI
jgi:alginate O-acetyltransferase complex protein AlgI